MKILAIETSCDETGVAILECKGDLQSPSFNVLSNQLVSQILAHRQYGGVYPNLAKRLHGENLIPLLKEALTEAKILSERSIVEKPQDVLHSLEIVLEREPELLRQFLEFIPGIKKPAIDAITVTHGPGLEPALWVGINFAKALSLVWDVPVIPTNHMEGHIASVLYKDDTPLSFPALALLVSGGHTELVLAKDWGMYEIVGQTQDDAVGEAFDKVARMLGLPYPGGPEIAAYAETSRKRTGQINIQLPRPMIDSGDCNFSFSGLKTAVLYKVKNKKISKTEKEDIARAFEDAVAGVLTAKVQKAITLYTPKILVVAGGVAANSYIQEELQKEISIPIRIPRKDVTGDNAIMIGMAGFLQSLYKKNGADTGVGPEIRAEGAVSLGV